MDIMLWIWYLVLCATSSSSWLVTASGSSEPGWSDECKPYSRPDPVAVIENDADIYLSALLNVHYSSDRGIYGCGPISRRGLIIFQALRWIINIINQDKGFLNGKRVHQSLIPGIKLGMRVYDTCNHRELGINYLTRIYPVLERGSDNCEDNSPIDLNSIALIDMSGVTRDPRLTALTRHYHLPINQVNQDFSIPPEIIAATLSSIVTDLKWTQIAIIHSSDEHSLQVIKLLGQSSIKDRFCLTLVQSLPKFQDEPYHATKSDSVAYIAALRNVLSMVSESVPILVLGADGSTTRLLEVMSERIDALVKHQWLFSSLPDPKLLGRFINSSVNFFALTPYPGSIDGFEEFWSRLLSSSPSSASSSEASLTGSSPSTAWLDEFLTTEGISRPESDQTKSGQIDMLWRTTQVLPIIQLMFIIASGLREAWLNRCDGLPGLCPDLAKLTRKELEADFLELRLEDAGLRQLMASRVVSSKSSSSNGNNNGEGLNLALAKLTFNERSSQGHSIAYHHMISYDSEKETSHIIDGSVPYRPSPCPPTGCERCLKVRQSRIIDSSVHFAQSSSSISSASTPGEAVSAPLSNSWSFEKRSDASSQSQPTITSLRDQECLARCTYSWKYGHKTTDKNLLPGSPSANIPIALNQPISPSSTPVGSSWEAKFESLQLNGTWYLILAILSALGVIIIIISGFYFLLVFPVSMGTTVLGYFILFGLVALYAVNFVYLTPTSFTVCLIRRLGMSLAYTMVMAALLVKTMNLWRLKTLRETGIEKLRLTTPSRLLMVACFLLSLQVIVTLIWLIFIPPKPNFKAQTCNWPSSDGLIATESIVSIVYILILGSMNVFFSILSWNSSGLIGNSGGVTASTIKSNSDPRESRWITAACLLVATVWSLWAAVVTYSPLVWSHSNLSIVVANLISATILVICLYVRRIKSVLRDLSKSETPRNSPQRVFHSSSLNGSYYGTLPKAQKLSISLFNQHNAASTAAVATLTRTEASKGSSTLTSSTFLPSNGTINKSDHQIDDGASSCASTSGSIQVQAEDLYPMEVYEGSNTLQQQYHYFANHK